MTDKTKLIIAAAITLSVPATVSSQIPSSAKSPTRQAAHDVLARLQAAVRNDDRRAVAALVVFPLALVRGKILGSTYVGSVKVFMTTYPTAFSQRVRKAVLAQNPDSMVIRDGKFVVGSGELAIGVRCETKDVRSCQTGVLEVRPNKPEP